MKKIIVVNFRKYSNLFSSYIFWQNWGLVGEEVWVGGGVVEEGGGRRRRRSGLDSYFELVSYFDSICILIEIIAWIK